MVWTFDMQDAEGTDHIPSAAMRKFYDWRRLIRDSNVDPRTAAAQVGDLHLEMYRGVPGRWTIRLNQEHRVFFYISWEMQTVRIEKIGTHDYW